MAKGNGTRKGSNTMLWWVSGAAVVLVAVLVLVSQSAKPAPSAEIKSDAERGAVRNVWGSASAKVKVAEFGDFQ